MYKSIAFSVALAVCALAAMGQAAPPAPAANVQARRTAQALYAQADAKLKAGDRAGALASLDSALEQDSSFDLARMTRLITRSELGQIDMALADLEMLKPGVKPADFLKMRGELLVSGGRYGEAIATYTDLISLEPSSAEAYRRRAHARQASEVDSDMPAALADYAKALELDPNMLRVYALRGEILSAHREEKAVEDNYQAWLARAPDDASAHAAYAGALVRLGKVDRAKVEIDRALALGPSTEAYLVRARITPTDQRGAFLSDIDKALALSPDDTFAYQLRAERRLRWGQMDQAMADTELALAAWPESYSARYLRSSLNRRAGHYDLAVRDLDLLIAREPDSDRLYNDRCWTRALSGLELDKARADCEAGLKLSPGDAAILDSRGMVKLRQGDLAGAVADYDKALAKRPDQASSLFGRGVAKRRLGAQAAGDADLAAARKAQPDVDKQFAMYGVTP